MKAPPQRSERFADTVESDDDRNSDMSHAFDVVDTAEVLERAPYRSHRPSMSTRPTFLSAGDTSRRVLTLSALLSFSFFAICGGPSGSEDLVRAGGPLVGLISMLVFPIVFLLPMGCMVTELATALPVQGGHAYWVSLAFGPSWGFQAGFWSWVANCIDCSMYASMTIATIFGPTASVKGTFWEFFVKATFAIVLALPGLWSLRVVGNVILFTCIFVLVPYFFVSIWAASEASHWSELLEVKRVKTTPTPDGDFVTSGAMDVNWSLLLNTLVWSYNGYLNLGVLAAHVVEPVYTYQRVLWYACCLIPLAYLLPYVTMMALDNPDWRRWEEGSLSEVAKTLGGAGLAGWIMAVNLTSSAGLYICALTACTYLANGMAKQGIAPTTVGLSTSSGTPHGAIFCSLAVILVVVNLDFYELLQLANALSALEAILVILSAIRLRFTMQDLYRPFKFCGDANPVVPLLLLVIPFLLFLLVLADALQSFTSGILVGIFLFIGIVYSRQADFARFRRPE